MVPRVDCDGAAAPQRLPPATEPNNVTINPPRGEAPTTTMSHSAASSPYIYITSEMGLKSCQYGGFVGGEAEVGSPPSSLTPLACPPHMQLA